MNAASWISDKASLDFLPGSVEALARWSKLRRQEVIARRSAALALGEPTVGRFGEVRGDTVHFDIIDQAGKHDPATPSAAGAILAVIPDRLLPGAAARRCSGLRKITGRAGRRKRPRTTASPTMGAARRRALPGVGFGRVRSAGSMDHAISPAARSRQNELQEAIDRRRLGIRTLPDLVLATHAVRCTRRRENRCRRASVD